MHFSLNIKCHILLSLLFFTNCSKDKNLNDNTDSGGKVMILGHRGMGTSYYKPGNTYESVTPVIGIGADGSEMDIQMTRDTVLVLFHDHLLNPVTTCNGRIYEQNWSEIKQCKYYALQNMIFINSADDLFSKIPNLTNYYFSFDSKIDGDAQDFELYQMQYLRAVKRLCEKYRMTDNVFIEGDMSLLKKAQAIGLTNKLFLNAAFSAQSIEDAGNNHFYGLSVATDFLNENVDLAHKKGLLIMTWSPGNYAENKKTLDRHPDIIQSDDPISILKLLNRYNYEYIIP